MKTYSSVHLIVVSLVQMSGHQKHKYIRAHKQFHIGISVIPQQKSGIQQMSSR